MQTVDVRHGGYRFMPGVSQYSCGVGALPGYALERVRFSRVLPLAEGFAKVAEIMHAAGRPLTAFAACELRSLAPFSEDGFKHFNETYTRTLHDWNIIQDGLNPVARSNVCPKINPPDEPGFYAFSYTVEALNAPPSFVVSGSGEAAEGKANYRDSIICLDDISPAGMSEKAKWVLGEMERRMGAFSVDWTHTANVQVYTIQDIYSYLETEFGRRGVLKDGITWHFNRPPVVGLEFEMDCRRVYVERLVDV